MKQIINTWGECIGTELEMSDIQIGQKYVCNNHCEPRYLQNDVVAVTNLGRKRVTVFDPSYPDEKFYLYPFMLQIIC